ncbi:MAG: signal peptidase II, partial [Frankia sp.]|nr:signal peptidase II [Frankia sp.]
MPETSEGPATAADARALERAYLDWGRQPERAAGKATGGPAAGGVTRPGADGERPGSGSAGPGEPASTTRGPSARGRQPAVGPREQRPGPTEGPGVPARAGADGPDAAAPPPDGGRPARGWRSRPLRVLVATWAVVLALDIVTKIIAVAELTGRAPVTLVPQVLDLRLTRNSGAAFSIAGGATVVFSLIAIAVVVVIVVTARRLGSTGWAFVLGAIVGGAMGNLVDRLVRSPGPLRGHVVDWIYLHHWPVFNVADMAVVLGGVLAVVLSARGVGLDGRRVTGQPPARPAVAADGGRPAAAPTTQP